MPYPTITLHPKRETPILAGHPWIFSNAINLKPEVTPGSLVQILAHDNFFLGIGTYNPRNSIAIRIISHEENTLIDVDFFMKRLQLLDQRKKSFLSENTTGYRICHADADGLPGLIIDRYADVIVFQIHTLGMEQFRENIITAIDETFHPTAIVERSDIEARKQEGLLPLEPKIHKGKITEPVEFTENGMIFVADVIHGQKTGFFLDQRNVRSEVTLLSKNKTVLNLFSYSGAFTVAALTGGAKNVITIDTSKPALELAKKNLELNNITTTDISPPVGGDVRGTRTEGFPLIQSDVFDYLNSNQVPPETDLIICDPPAFTKSATKQMEALKAYSSLNKTCLEKLKTGGILITSSCSGRVTLEDFKNMLRIATGRARKDVQILKFMEHAEDHTQKLSFPEGSYLKTAILQVL